MVYSLCDFFTCSACWIFLFLVAVLLVVSIALTLSECRVVGYVHILPIHLVQDGPVAVSCEHSTNL
jgi:hypothetical protein